MRDVKKVNPAAAITLLVTVLLSYGAKPKTKLFILLIATSL